MRGTPFERVFNLILNAGLNIENPYTAIPMPLLWHGQGTAYD